ncbi:MAG: hypothetical protein ACLQAR_15145 [Steroidobacteraceae bacterium]|jgi:hypothetical protein
MASDVNPVQIPAISLVHGSQAPTRVIDSRSGGNSLPPSGNAPAPAAAGSAAASARAAATAGTTTLQAQVALLNKYLNDSGRPDQFRVDPSSDATLIQEINPATGEVIAEYPAITFPALARSVGISGAVIDEHA